MLPDELSVPGKPPVSLVPTSDGSFTLLHGEHGQTYHSVHGAFQEARHVFLEQGLCHYVHRNAARPVRVLEVGFGTGLNFLVSAAYCLQHGIGLDYTGIEPAPVPPALLTESGYADLLDLPEHRNAYLTWYPGRETLHLSPAVQLRLTQSSLMQVASFPESDVLYFDAFAPSTQPEMWTPDAIAHAVSALQPGGVFVSYSITGKLKRTLKELGFTVEKPKGAAGKREMIRAIRD